MDSKLLIEIFKLILWILLFGSASCICEWDVSRVHTLLEHELFRSKYISSYFKDYFPVRIFASGEKLINSDIYKRQTINESEILINEENEFSLAF